jgi:subtilisin family serine protease
LLSDTEKWLLDLVNYVHPLSEKSPAEASKPFTNKILGRNGSVRIAILDTGIYLSGYALHAHGDRVKGFKDWILGEKNGNQWTDSDGHGTHSATLLMKVAPKADIYMARVFEKQGSGRGAVPTKLIEDNIAQVF